jgi:hypothetical protein
LTKILLENRFPVEESPPEILEVLEIVLSDEGGSLKIRGYRLLFKAEFLDAMNV